jgi:hypothetical protein
LAVEEAVEEVIEGTAGTHMWHLPLRNSLGRAYVNDCRLVLLCKVNKIWQT